MTQKVLKYIIGVEDCELSMPEDAKVIHVHEQTGGICLWIIGDLEKRHLPRCFYVTGTGHPIPGGTEYLGTAHCGPFVWHVWGDPQ